MVKHLDATLAALADPQRRSVVDALRAGPRRAGELAEECGTSAPVMSRHLRRLRECGLVECALVDEDARVRVYRLRAAPLAELRGWLEEVEAFWAAQLESFGRHVQRKARKK